MKLVASVTVSALILVITICWVDGSPGDYLADAALARIKTTILTRGSSWMTLPSDLKNGNDGNNGVFYVVFGGATLKSIGGLQRLGQATLGEDQQGKQVLKFSLNLMKLAIEYNDIIYVSQGVVSNTTVGVNTDGANVDLTLSFVGGDDSCVGVMDTYKINHDPSKITTTGGDAFPNALNAVKANFQTNVANSLSVLMYSSVVTSLYNFDLCGGQIVTPTTPPPPPTTPTTAPPTTKPPVTPPTTKPPVTPPTTKPPVTLPTTKPPVTPPTTKPPVTLPTTKPPVTPPTTKPPVTPTPAPSIPMFAEELGIKLSNLMIQGFKQHIYEWSTMPAVIIPIGKGATLNVGQSGFVTTAIALSNPHYEPKTTAGPEWIHTQTLDLHNTEAAFNSIMYTILANMTYTPSSGISTIAATRVSVSFNVQSALKGNFPCVRVNSGSLKWVGNAAWPQVDFKFTDTDPSHQRPEVKDAMEKSNSFNFGSVITNLINKSIADTVANSISWCQ